MGAVRKDSTPEDKRRRAEIFADIKQQLLKLNLTPNALAVLHEQFTPFSIRTAFHGKDYSPSDKFLVYWGELLVRAKAKKQI